MKSLFELLRLCRLPTVFTALADILLGYLLTHSRLEPPVAFALLLGASAGLYLSGMVFNDYFDFDQDLRERPQRPIPSGGVSRWSALLFGGGLMAVGLMCAALASRNSLYIALLLSVAVLLYDGPLKRTPLGPFVMGSCRFLNVLLGASAVNGSFGAVWQQPQLWVAGCLGTYIVGVTLFARREAAVSSRLSLAVALLVANAGLLGLAAWIMNWAALIGLELPVGAVPKPWTVLVLLGAIALTINRHGLTALVDPRPQHVQPTIGIMLLSIIMLDAMLIYFQLGSVGIPYALATVSLLIPAILLRRWIPLT